MKKATSYFSLMELEVSMTTYGEYEHIFQKKSTLWQQQKSGSSARMAEDHWSSQCVRNRTKRDVLSSVFHFSNICALCVFVRPVQQNAPAAIKDEIQIRISNKHKVSFHYKQLYCITLPTSINSIQWLHSTSDIQYLVLWSHLFI